MIIQMPEEVLFKLVDYAKGLGRKEERIDSFKEPKFITQIKLTFLMERGMLQNGSKKAS